MSNCISSTGSRSFAMAEIQRPPRPDSSTLAENLFSKIDTAGKGYVEKSDLENAFQQVSSTSSSTSVDELFSSLDSSGDGKVTKDEMSSGLKSLMASLDSQFESMRMSGAMSGMAGMPPPPPPGDDAGFTKEELQDQLSKIGSSDSKRSSLISSVIDNFDKADSDGNGKVSFKEAMAFEQSSASSSTDSTTIADSTLLTGSSSGTTEERLMQQIMKLAQAYGVFGRSDESSAVSAIA